MTRALADRVMLLGFTIGRKGLLGYLRAVGGSNIVKVIPSNGSASESQTADKRLKVICGANTSYLADSDWIGENTPLTLCDVRVSPNNSVKPNLGTTELAEALARVLPFTATDDARPILQCVNFVAKDGKLTLVSADGFRLAVVTLDYDDGEGQALISRDDLAGVVNALRKAKRARVSFEPSGESLDGTSLIIDTELIRYKWIGVDGNFPDYEKLIPTEFNTVAHFDTVEAIKATNSLKALSDGKSYPIDIWLDDSGMKFASPEEPFGETFIPADVEVKDNKVSKVRIDGRYLASVLKACGGMVEFKLTNGSSPMLFNQNGYQVVVMPMLTSEATEQAKADREPVAEAEPEAEAEAEKPKRKRSRAKQPVTV